MGVIDLTLKHKIFLLIKRLPCCISHCKNGLTNQARLSLCKTLKYFALSFLNPQTIVTTKLVLEVLLD